MASRLSSNPPSKTEPENNLEDNRVLLEQHIVKLTESEREELDKTITGLALGFYDWFELEKTQAKLREKDTSVKDNKSIFGYMSLFNLRCTGWYHYLKYTFNLYSQAKLREKDTSVKDIKYFDEIKSLLNRLYPKWYIPSFIYSWFERHSKEWIDIVNKFRTKYHDVPEEINIKEFNGILMKVLSDYDMFRDEDHFIETAERKIDNYPELSRAQPDPFSLYTTYLYTRWEVFKQKTDKYKECLKELTEHIDDILSKIPKKEREWNKDQLKDFYTAVYEFLPKRMQICWYELHYDLLRNPAITLKVLQKLYSIEKEIKDLKKHVAVKVADVPYVLHGISPKLARQKYLECYRISSDNPYLLNKISSVSISERFADDVPQDKILFEVDKLVEQTKDVIDSIIAKGYLKTWTDSDEPPKTLLKDFAAAIQKWNKETPEHQVPLPDWLNPKTKKKSNQIEKSESPLDYIKNNIRNLLIDLSNDFKEKAVKPTISAYQAAISICIKIPIQDLGKQYIKCIKDNGVKLCDPSPNNRLGLSKKNLKSIIKRTRNKDKVILENSNKSGYLGKKDINQLIKTLIEILSSPKYNTYKNNSK